jgi:hypothetical protein
VVRDILYGLIRPAMCRFILPTPLQCLKGAIAARDQLLITAFDIDIPTITTTGFITPERMVIHDFTKAKGSSYNKALH